MAARRVSSSLVAGLKRLHPEQFENLTYDILLLSGVQNLRWRTPGADGGRDLEGEVISVDFSGETVRQRWYIECKRYAKSVDWPTLYEKLTVAINHQADYLLLVTTANVSVPCRDEIQRHNERRIAAFTELISTRIEDSRKHGRFINHHFKPDRDTFAWCRPNPLPVANFDASSLRAALATIKNVLGLADLQCRVEKENMVVTVATTAALRTNALFGLVSTFGMIDWQLEKTEIVLKAR